MILVEHWSKSSFVTVFINGRWIKPDLAFQRYSVGKTKPNYPVPALPMVVDIAPDYCAVFVWHGPAMTCDYVYYVAGNDPNTETLP